MDLGYSGRWFTWERGNFACNNIRENLDRGVANFAWYDLFSNYNLLNLDHPISDHYPIMLNMDVGVFNGMHGPYKFKFETGWLLDTTC